MSPDSPRHDRTFSWIALFVFLAGLGVTLVFSRDLYHKADTDARTQLETTAEEAVVMLEERLASLALLSEGGAALFQASEEVSRREWSSFVSRLDAGRHLAGLQGLGFTAWVSRAQLPALLAAARRDLPGYALHPAGDRAAYALVQYVEPQSGRNLRVLGFDNLPDPTRRALLEASRDDGRTVMSGMIRLMQEDGVDEQPGFLLFTPVYRHGMPAVTVTERRAALQGWVFAAFRMHDFMGGVYRGWRHQFGPDLHLEIYAGDRRDPAQLLFRDGSGRAASGARVHEDVRTLVFAGQRWRLVFSRAPDAVAGHYGAAWMALAAGSLVSLLLAALLLLIGRTRREAARMAAAMTADIVAGQERLKESEYRAKFALEGADLGVWDRNLGTGRLLLSRRWYEILEQGYTPPGETLEDWLALVHPDDLPALQDRVRAVLEKGATLYESEHRMRCPDGRYKWVHDRGMVVARDGQGRPLRMVGTLADIDARKRLELERERYYRLFQLSSEPMCISSAGDGRLVAVNRCFTELLGYAEAEMVGQSPERFMYADDVAPTRAVVARFHATGQLPEAENRYRTRDGRVVILSWKGFLDRQNGLLYLSARDVTESHAARHRIRRLDRLYAALSACNSAIVHCGSEEELAREACDIVVRHGGLRMAWIGRIDAATRRVVPLVTAGEGTAYVDGIEISVAADDSHGRGPVGVAGRENRPVWFDDVDHDPAFAPWRDRAVRHGFRAAAALPLCRDGQPVAVFCLYASEPDFFDDEIRRLLIEMAGDISYALDKFAAEAESERARASLEEAEQRFRALVEQSLAGAYIVQDGHFVYVNPRFAAIVGHDDYHELLGRAVESVVVPADRDGLRDNVRRLLEGETQHLVVTYTALRKDGQEIGVGTNSSVATYRGRPAVIGLLQDMSDRQVAETQVRRYAEKLESMLVGTVGMVTAISDLRDPYTAGHERRVATLAAAIGRELGLEASRVEGLRIAGLLHDVGNILIPAEILSKPGRLSETEFGIIREHARAGHDVLQDIEFPWPVARVALQHHERLDGSGYPQGLKGDEIVLEARIVAVADVVEAMSSHRPFRPALGLDAALAEIEAGAGVRYDAEVVAACLRLFREKDFVLAR